MLISALQYAEKHGKDRATVLKLIRAGRIPAVKIGNQWAIEEDTPFPADARVKSGQYRDWRKPKANKPQE